MPTSRNIIESAVRSPFQTASVAVVQAAGARGHPVRSRPLRRFRAQAFARLPTGMVDTFLQPENRDQRVMVLTAHVVPGDLSGGVILNGVRAGGGRYEMTTVSGDTRVAVPSGGGLAIQSETGNVGVITTADFDPANGVIHGVNAVLVPE